MITSCKACVLTKKHTIEVMEVPMPKCADNAMIIKIEAAGVCGTDLHLFDTEPQYPFIPAHEMCGRIVEMGSNANKAMRCYTGDLKVGDRICLYPWVVCGTCESCLTYGIGACGICENAFVYGVPYEELGFGGVATRSNSVKEAPYLMGGFAEYMYVFPGTFCWKVPDDMPSKIAALLDPMAVAMRGVELAMRAPGIFEDSFNLGSTVLVIGDGQIATLVALIARTLGVQHIIISGFSDEKLALAKDISGADEMMNSAKLSIEERRAIITKYNGKNGADVVFQCAGSPYAFRDGVDLMKNVGTLIEIGNVGSGKAVDFYPGKDLCNKHGTYIGMSVNTANTFNKAFQMLCKHERLGLERLLTHRATMKTLGEVMSKGKDPDYMKGWLDLSE